MPKNWLINSVAYIRRVNGLNETKDQSFTLIKKHQWALLGSLMFLTFAKTDIINSVIL